jgi:uncharacterized protein (TIGR02145 family)/gliding motility-associated-like protein
MTTWIDFDKDGYLDLISASSTNSHAIYLNNKNESFLPTDVHFPVWPTMGGDGAVISGDFNSDGFSDTFFTGTYNYFSELYENNAGTSFTLVSNNGLIPLASSDAAFGDYNGDGLLDLIIQGWDGSQNVTRIYKNTLNGNQPFSCGDPVLYEGQTYNTVQIGTQCWFRENLNVGTKINVGQNQTDNGIIEKHCYDNLESNCTTYGGLYSWHELMDYNSSESVQGICPPGWHIPSNSEMCTMMTFLDPTVNCSNTYTHIGTDVGGKLKETGLEHWNEPNTGASNSSGFSALGSGYGIDGSFTNLKTFTHFYTSTYVNGSGVYVHRLDYNTQDVFYQFGPDYSLGASHPVRCVREAGISYLNLPDSIIECISDSIKLDGTPGFKDYLWSTGETSQTIWVKTNGVYKLQVKDNYNNIQTDSTYVNLLNFDLVASDTSLCSGESATLQVIIHEQPVDTLPKCLVAYYPFNGNANDESGNGHHGTNYGASLTADRFGNPNSAYYFNGNAMIEIVDAPDLNVPTGKISISAWAYKIGNYTQGHIIGKRTLCAYFQYQIGFWLGAAGIGWGGSGSYLENVLFDFPSEVWIHFVGTFDGLTWKLYQNGILVGSLDAPLPSPVPEPLLIGNSGSCQYFIGNIDDVRIYDCALTDSEILQLYNSGTKKKDQYLISWTTGENSEVIQVSPLGETTYGVTVSDGINSCYQEITIHSANPDLAFEVSPSQGYAPLTVNFNYTGQDDFLRWDFGDGQMDYVHKSTSHVYDSAGTYYSKVFVNTGDPDSCTAFDFAIIQVFENPTLEIPDFFTPNADGFNDYFYVKSTGMQAMNVKIYDPWGDFIYEIKDVEGKWDGMTEQGKEAPEGTYYYYLAATALDKEILERKGSVLLIRDEINAYPNPAIESLNINLNGTMSGNIRVDILNVQGVRIRSGSMNASNEVKIDISGLPHGFYILKMDDNKNQRYTSFIKR